MTATIAVIVCTYLEERFEQLAAALESIDAQTRQPDETIVVVDGDVEVAESVASIAPEAKVITLNERSGLAAARNVGIAESTSDILLFLDDDARAHPEWVARLGATLEEPCVLGASGWAEPRWLAPRPRWLPGEFMWTLGCSYDGQPPHRVRVRNVYGGCCALRRMVFEQLSGYDERLGRGPRSLGGGEEAELCLRAQTVWPDGVFVHEPAARISHDVDPGRLRVGYVVRRAYDEGVMKASVRRIHGRALGPELEFAFSLPRAAQREILAGLRGDIDGGWRGTMICVLASAVLLGLARGRLGRPPRDLSVPRPSAPGAGVTPKPSNLTCVRSGSCI